MRATQFTFEPIAQWHHPEFNGLGLFFASRTGGTRRGGKTTAPKTTARKGTTKSAAARLTAHDRRSSSAGRANARSAEAPTTKGEPSTRRTKRGPGAVGRNMGRAQSSAGKPRGTPKRAK